MRSFSDLLETTSAAADSTDARNLTSRSAVKTALRISDTDSDSLIDALLPRVSSMIVAWCRLARDVAGSKPTFARETLRATWYAQTLGRGPDIFLPWRAPVFSVDAVTEDGVALSAGSDYVLLGAKGGRIMRLSDGSPSEWSGSKIIVTWKAGFSPTATLAANIDPTIEAAAIEQLKALLFAADRDPAVRSESVPDLASKSYSVPGGDVMGASALLPSVRDMLAPWRNPTP